MRALFYNFSQKKFILKEAPQPRVKPDQVLVKVIASNLCGTDLHIINGPLTRKVYNKKEIILGHSFTGIISEIGGSVKKFKKGDRVFASDFVWCGTCQRCKEGDHNLCDNRFVFGMELPGSHAEYIAVPDRAIFHLPKKIDFLDGSMATDILSLDVHAINKSKAKPSDRVLILGTGPVGLVLGMLLRICGVKKIFAAEPIRYRRNLAKKTFKPKIISGGDFQRLKGCFDVIFEASGSAKALNSSQRFLRRGGKIVVVAVQREKLNLNALKLVSRELSLFGIFGYTKKDIETSLRLLARKKINFKKVITHKFYLKDGAKAYKLLKNRRAGRITFLAPTIEV